MQISGAEFETLPSTVFSLSFYKRQGRFLGNVDEGPNKRRGHKIASGKLVEVTEGKLSLMVS